MKAEDYSTCYDSYISPTLYNDSTVGKSQNNAPDEKLKLYIRNIACGCHCFLDKSHFIGPDYKIYSDKLDALPNLVDNLVHISDSKRRITQCLASVFSDQRLMNHTLELSNQGKIHISCSYGFLTADCLFQRGVILVYAHKLLSMFV